MPKITKDMLLGKTKEEVTALVLVKFNAGNLTQKEFNTVNAYLGKLNTGQKTTDGQMLDQLIEDLNM